MASLMFNCDWLHIVNQHLFEPVGDLISLVARVECSPEGRKAWLKSHVGTDRKRNKKVLKDSVKSPALPWSSARTHMYQIYPDGSPVINKH